MRWADKIARPWLAGAAYVVLLAVHAAGASDENAETLGAHASAINSFVRTRYSTDIFKVVGALVLVAAVAGAFLGTLAGQLVELRDRAAKQERSPLSVTARALLVTVALHAWLELVAMADTPALYVDGFYARGGLARTVQVLATDTFGGGALVFFGVVAIAVFVAGPPCLWPTLSERLRAFALRVPTAWQTAGVWVGAGVLAALSVVAFALTPHPHHATRAPNAKPNVLVIAADSLRFDRLTPKLAPHLSALADRGTRFDRAYVSLPRTFPSWVTILTGRHPHHHGIRTMFPRWDGRAKDFDALPERLAKAGYRTSVVSDFAGDIFSRIDLGFGEIDTPTFDMRELVRQRAVERETPLLPFLVTRAGRAIFPVVRELATAADPQLVAHDALRSIDRADGGPFFETVFFSTAHFPYAAPEPYAAAFTKPSYRGRFKYDKPVGLGSDAPPNADDVAQARGLYDGAVASIDDAVDVLLRGLDDRGLTESTIIVITADHGESLDEPGRGSGHGDHLF
ncbi:MAG: sulfatase-like hydrolase/transferase, partial [Polyangiaceae bacterium]